MTAIKRGANHVYYLRTDGGTVSPPSVTAITGHLFAAASNWGAGEFERALRAACPLDLDDACAAARAAPRTQAMVGTATAAYAAQRATQPDATPPADVLHDMIQVASRAVGDVRPGDVYGHAMAYERWRRECPYDEALAAETPVGCVEYAGTPDLVVRRGDARVVVDFKTTASHTAARRLPYAMQVAAYASLVPADSGQVVTLLPTGDYAVHDVDVGAMLPVFMAMLTVAQAAKAYEKE